MNRAEIEEKTASYLKTFVSKEGYQLLKTEYVKEDGVFYLRAYLDLTEEEKATRKELIEKENIAQIPGNINPITDQKTEPDNESKELDGIPQEPGIGINDCAKVSRRLSKWLDKEDFIPEEYILEVCSRGYLKENEY